MKRVALACAVVLALAAGPAHAQWTGFYVGGSVGYSAAPWHTDSNQMIFDFESTQANPHVNGVVGGGQAGYNFQVGSWVWGFQADLQASGQKASQNWTDPGLTFTPPIEEVVGVFVPRCCGPAQLSSSWALPWFATLMARGGVLVAPNWLVYITGGVAFGEVRYKLSLFQPG
jgi:outer membrane immunogenic protein